MRNHIGGLPYAMKYVSLPLSWFFGLGFLLLGFALVSNDLLLALSWIAISILLLPPVRTFVYTLTHLRVSTGMRSVMVLALFLLGGQTFIDTAREVAIQQEDDRRNTELRAQFPREPTTPFNAQGRQEPRRHMSKNDIQVLADEAGVPADRPVRENRLGTPEDVTTHEAEFMTAPPQAEIATTPQHDPDPGEDLLETLHRAPPQAEVATTRQHDPNRRETILETLHSIPATAYKRRFDLYTELVAVSPKEEAAVENLAFYEQKYAEQLHREHTEAQRTRNETEQAIEETLASWAPLSVSLQNGKVTVVTKDASVAEDVYLAMVQSLCMFAPLSLGGVSEVSFVNRASFQGLVFEGGETECYQFVQARDKAIWVRGITHRVLN